MSKKITDFTIQKLSQILDINEPEVRDFLIDGNIIVEQEKEVLSQLEVQPHQDNRIIHHHMRYMNYTKEFTSGQYWQVNDVLVNEVRFYGDPGRVCRPLFVVEDHHLVLTSDTLSKLKLEESTMICIFLDELYESRLYNLRKLDQEGKTIHERLTNSNLSK
ncbi:14277_t:CDS:2 [Funneliformis caledonium]|uniref:14277_t:CDS:1 n=1 Tax=Funneliformis caledonium TaxID=1117310 RepID=A0A9N8WBV4_9GLOM|nr:14277_t:CDS:2 [Funneliformis caledonium]